MRAFGQTAEYFYSEYLLELGKVKGDFWRSWNNIGLKPDIFNETSKDGVKHLSQRADAVAKSV